MPDEEYPFVAAVQVACKVLCSPAGAKCIFPSCNCKMLPDAMRDALGAFVLALAKKPVADVAAEEQVRGIKRANSISLPNTDLTKRTDR